MRIKRKYLTLMGRDIPWRKKLKVLEWTLRQHDMWGPFPLEAQIDIESRCNANCIMCNRGRFIKGQQMSFETFKEVINKFGSGLCIIIPYGFGEPLLHQDFVPMMEYAKSKGILYSINTNGSVLHKHDLKRMLAVNPTAITISIDHYKPDEYERIRRGLKFDVLERNVRELVRVRNEMFPNPKGREKWKVPLIQITTPMGVKEFLDEDFIPQMLKMKDDWGVDNIVFKDFVWQFDMGPSVESNSIRQNIDADEIQAKMDRYKHRNDITWKLSWQGKMRCVLPKRYVYVADTGDLHICGCNAEHWPVLGNIHEIDSIMDVWNKSGWRQMVKDMLEAKSDYQFCRSCEGWGEDKSEI